MKRKTGLDQRLPDRQITPEIKTRNHGILSSIRNQWDKISVRIAAYSLILFLFYLAFVLYEVFFTGNITHNDTPPFCVDFGLFYTAGKMTLQGQIANIFQVDVHHALLEQILHTVLPFYLPWLYPPTFLLLIAPLAALPFRLALVVWLTLTIALAGFSFYRMLPKRKELAFLLFGFPGFMMNLRWGQNGFLSAGLLGFGIAFLDDNPILSGICFGLMAYKPQFAVLVFLVLLLSGKWKVFLWACISALGAILISVVCFGTQVWMNFFESLLSSSSAIFGDKLISIVSVIVSPYIIFRLSGCGSQWSTIIQGVFSVLALASTVWVWRKSGNRALKGAMLVLCIPLATSYFMQYDLVLLGIPLVLLAYDCFENGYRKAEMGLLALLWIMPGINWPIVQLTYIQICPFVLIAVVLMILLRVKRERKNQAGLLPAISA